MDQFLSSNNKHAGTFLLQSLCKCSSLYYYNDKHKLFERTWENPHGPQQSVFHKADGSLNASWIIKC